MKCKLLFVLMITVLACVTLIHAQEPVFDHYVFMPLAQVSYSAPAPIRTPTPTPQPIYELCNGDFESGQDGSWTEYYSPPRELPLVNTFVQRLWPREPGPELEGHGDWLGWLGGVESSLPLWETVTAIEQLVTVPSREGIPQSSIVLYFEYLIYSKDWHNYGGDAAKLLFDGVTLASWDVISLNNSKDWSEWTKVYIDLEDWQGKTVMLRFEMVNDFISLGDFHIDNVKFGVVSFSENQEAHQQ